LQKQALFCVLTLAFVLVLNVSVCGASQGIPIDIPGTQVHFFTLRYEAATPPYEQADLVWQRLSSIFQQWVEEGQNPNSLTAEMVTVETAPSGNKAIYLKGILIVEVDEYHAKQNRTNVDQLAKTWADNLRQGVTVFVESNVPSR